MCQVCVTSPASSHMHRTNMFTARCRGFIIFSFLPRRTDGHSSGADGAWHACWVMIALCHDALTLLLFVLAVGSRIRGALEWSYDQRTCLLQGAQLFDILSLHLGQDLFRFRLLDDFDFEFPHTVSQLEVGSLSGQLVFRVAHVGVVVQVEDDSMSSRTHVVHTGKTLSNLGHSRVQATHFSIDSTQNLLSSVDHMFSSGRRAHTSGLALSYDGETRCLPRRNHCSRCTTVDASYQDSCGLGFEAVQLCQFLSQSQKKPLKQHLASRTRGHIGRLRLILPSRQTLLLLRTVLGDRCVTSLYQQSRFQWQVFPQMGHGVFGMSSLGLLLSLPFPRDFGLPFWKASSPWIPHADRSMGCGVELAAACARLTLSISAFSASRVINRALLRARMLFGKFSPLPFS